MRSPYFLALALIAACSAGVPGTDDVGDGTARFATGGRFDDYLSFHGMELDATTTLRVTLAGDDALLPTEAERLERARERASEEMDRLTKALSQELWAVWDKQRRTGDRALVARMDSDSLNDGKLAEDGAFEWRYRVNLAGPRDMLSWFPGFSHVLTVKVGSREYQLKVDPTEATPDAYPDYAALFRGRDGIDIAIHVGDDHYAAGSTPPTEGVDIAQARSLYELITTKLGYHQDLRQGMLPGLLPPPGVRHFEGLNLQSGGFRGELLVDGPQGETRRIPLRVSLYHADMVPDERLDELVEAFEESARVADVVIYGGHAGQDPAFSGVVLHYPVTGTAGALRRSIPANRFRELEMPRKYQLFMFAGCGTYGTYPDKLFENPAKDPSNLDVISTINYSTNARRAWAVEGLLEKLLEHRQRRFYPQSYGQILEHIETVEQKLYYRGIYGVHGLGDNPRVSPLAELTTVGMACAWGGACGAVDSLCVRRPATGGGVVASCGVACTHDSGCPGESKCIALTQDGVAARQCVADAEQPW